jgi:fibronectin type III domain protein
MESPDDLDDRFPKSEAEIIRLARAISAGLRAHPDLFPSPPFSADEIDQQIDAFLNADETAVVARARAERAIAAMHRAFDRVIETARRQLGHDEHTPGGEDSEATEAPGQTGFLEVVGENDGTVSLTWTAPRDGGDVAIYFIQRRQRDAGGKWKVAAVSFVTEATLSGQESGFEFEYQVIALNRIGEGPASNIVRAGGDAS